ncbi:MAG: O-antigen translocase, partial [Bacteroidales bacterium]|nr:O-antigen translocase [Bacteroidales bacterium]
DYYPRLSAVAYDNELSKTTINQQAEVALLILSPIVIVFTVFIHSVIVILYSDKFLAVDTMVLWAAIGMLFRATSWSLGFLLLAKGASKLYLINAIFFESYFLLFNILGYKYGGLTGLGLSYALGYFASTVQMSVVCSKKYMVKFTPRLLQIFIFQFILALCSLIAVLTLNNPYPYLVGVILIGISTWYSVKELNKRMDFKAIISGLIKKYPFKK